MIQFENQSGKPGDERTSIRQIAILLHTLPERTHRVLLGQLGRDDKQRIAEALLELGDVDALEQHRVVKRMHDELQAETTSARKVESEIQDEIQIGRARVSKKRSSPIYRTGDSTIDSSGGDDSPESMPGSATVPFAEKMATQPGESGVPSNTSSAEHSCEHSFQTQTDVVSGQAAMSPTPEMLQLMFAQFHQTQAAGVLPTAVIRSVIRPPSGPDGNGEQDEGSSVVPFDTSAPSPPSSTTDGEAEAAELAERVDQFLTSLSPRELCQALGMATTKQAFLVLCGLPNETAETVLDMLPRRQSRKVRSDMRRMGRLQLSDIDSAKQAVTEIAIRLTQQPQSFAA